MSFAALHANAVDVVKGILDDGGHKVFREADYRHPIERLPEQANHRHFQVVATPIVEALERHGVLNDVRRAEVRVRVFYFAGGGDAGGGDRQSINALGFEDTILIGKYLENPLRYDAQNTGIQCRYGFRNEQTFEGDRSAVWDCVVTCQWEENEDARAVVA